MSYVYIRSDYTLYTVGFYDPNGKWQSDSDHTEQEMAARRVAWLNGSGNEVFKGTRTIKAGGGILSQVGGESK